VPLTPGTKLGPYEIVSPLGAGGMGEVYRARDARLGRDVAIKVLPPHLSQHPEVRARFEREAKSVSALNHPNICVLYDVGREGDVDYLVMELIEGDTLATRLARGPLPATEVVRIGAQIADALDRAHRAGVVHRDLKPGNVMLTRSGAKLMDFGLARAVTTPRSTSGAFTQSPTIAQPLTAEGTIVGTFQYMAPEQLEGKDADARADLWSLGCVLYEMTTGKRAFEGSNQASLISAIMRDQPRPMTELVPMSPPALERLVSALLEKDPADRIQTAHDVKLQLQWTSDAGTSLSGVAPRMATRGARKPSWLLVGAAVLVAAAGTALVMSLVSRGEVLRGEGGIRRFALASADLVSNSAPALSPDGRTVVLSARVNGERVLLRRDLARFDLEPIKGAEDASSPFFSPDGAWVGYVTPTAIKKIPLGGGAPQNVLVVDRVSSADWSPSGYIYFSQRSGGIDGRTGLMRVAAAGGTADIVATLDSTAGESEGWLPEVLPDGETVLYSVTGKAWRVVAVKPDGTRVNVVDNALLARYVAPYLLYCDQASGTVLVAPFDTGELRLTGPAISLTEPVELSYCYDAVGESIVYVPVEGGGAQEVVWMDRSGKSTRALEMRTNWAEPRVSPDGKRVILRKAGAECELWLLDVATGSVSRVVQGGDNHGPVWAPDGSRIVYNRLDGTLISLSMGGARESSTLAKGRFPTPVAWAQGGNLLVSTLDGAGRGDLWVQRMDGNSKAEPFLATPASEASPAITRDGKWIAYVSDETGTHEVYVRAYPDAGSVWQISVGGGDAPLWSRDGRELYYVTGTRMMAVRISTSPGLTASDPVQLFDGGFSLSRTREFDVAPDGRFIVIRDVGADGGQRVHIVQNWQDELTKTPQ